LRQPEPVRLRDKSGYGSEAPEILAQ
jgi:hypothetical protein